MVGRTYLIEMIKITTYFFIIVIVLVYLINLYNKLPLLIVFLYLSHLIMHSGSI